MKTILLLGTRGIPANYGGFETCVEELANRLSKDYEVVVYNRNKGKYNDNAQVKVIYIPSIKFKILETLSHTLFSIIHALIFYPKSIFMVFNVANAPVLILPWLLRRKIALNTDGLEWKRDKWGKFGKLYFQSTEWLASKIVNNIVTDSKGMCNYYLNRWKRKSTIIEYGAYIGKSKKIELLNKFNIKKNNYFLQITRFEPENNPLLTIQAFNLIKNKYPDFKLVLVGGVTYSSKYSKEIYEFKSEQVILPGYIYDEYILTELRANCKAYIHGNQVGGTNPALLEAMGDGAFVIARDIHFNREVLENNGIYYGRNITDLAEKMNYTIKNNLIDQKQSAQLRISKYYNWVRITNEYSKLFKRIV